MATKKELATVKDVKDALKVEKEAVITLDQIIKAKELYKTIAQEGFKTKKWTHTSLSLGILVPNFLKWLDTPEATTVEGVTDVRRTLFTQDNGGWNAQIQVIDVASGEIQKEVSIKIKSVATAENLIDNFNFWLV